MTPGPAVTRAIQRECKRERDTFFWNSVLLLLHNTAYYIQSVTFPCMCGRTSAWLVCPCIQVGTECQWPIKVILYDVCKWLCYEMSPSVRKRRSEEVTQSWEEMVWWIMYLYEKVLLGYACVAGRRSITVSEWMLSPTCFFFTPRFISNTLISFLLSVYTVQINPVSATYEGALAEHLHCSYRISWPTFTVLCFVMT